MPIYVYVCPKCGEKFEVIKPMAEAGKVEKCPKCKTEAMRTPATCGIQFKGKGWTPKFGKR